MNGRKTSGGGRGRAGGQQGKDAGQRRPMFRRRKVCKFCADKIDDINYKDVKLLTPFVPERGKILPRRISGTCAMHQRKLQTALKRARQIAVNMKEELNNKLAEFATTVDNLEEVFENREQIEISKFYERMPKPTNTATDEFLEGALSYRMRSESEGDGKQDL